MATGATLNVSGILAGGTDLIKLGGGQLELSGSLPNTISNAPRIKQGTLLLNKAPGVDAIRGTAEVRDESGAPQAYRQPRRTAHGCRGSASLAPCAASSEYLMSGSGGKSARLCLPA